MSEENFPTTLLEVIDYASREALSARADWRFQPLSSAAYTDSRQQMLTATGLVGTKSEIANVLSVSQLARWEFSRLTWSDPVRIQVPELTLKERIFIDQLLPKFAKKIPAIQKRLGFLIADTKSDSEEKLRNYVSFQRHYPFWGKVAI
jgi:putative O-methyltransferase